MAHGTARKTSLTTWLVVGLVLAATAAGLAGLWYRRPHLPPKTPAQLRAEERAAAHAQLEALDARVLDALAANKPETVVDSLWALVQKHPDSAEARNSLALVLSRMGRLGNAFDQYQQSLRLDNQQVEVHLNAGTLAWNLGYLDQASKYFDAAVRLDPRNPRCLLRRADYQLTRAKPDAAARQHDMALTLVDLNAVLTTDRREDYQQYGHAAWALMADVMARENNPVAIEKIDRAIADTPPDQRKPGGKLGLYLRKKAALLCQFNRFAEALAALRALDTQDKLDPDVVEQVAVCQNMLAGPAAAAREYTAALAVSNLDIAPPDWRLLAGATRWCLKAGDKATARQYLAALQARNPAAPDLAEMAKQLKD
jgi:tetratricopeptide (TPR) repeat protein